MKTKAIPSVIMLAAGGIRCVAGAINKQDTTSFLWSLVLTMIIFYGIGIIAKIVLDRNFKDMLQDAVSEGEDAVSEEAEDSDIELENVEEQQSEDAFVKEKFTEDELVEEEVQE